MKPRHFFLMVPLFPLSMLYISFGEACRHPFVWASIGLWGMMFYFLGFKYDFFRSAAPFFAASLSMAVFIIILHIWKETMDMFAVGLLHYPIFAGVVFAVVYFVFKGFLGLFSNK